MTLRSAQRSSLVDQAIDQLRDQVTSGEWPIGSRIPTENELATELGVGRNTVREAVRVLTHAGMLECRQGAGTFVVAANEAAAGMARRLAAARLRDILEVRRGLEVEAARLAAHRRTDDDLGRIDAALDHREQAWGSGDAQAFIEADVALHETIVAAAHNAVLAELYDDFSNPIRESLLGSVGSELTDARYVDHARLCAAIRDRDDDAAAREASEHLNETLRALREDEPGTAFRDR